MIIVFMLIARVEREHESIGFQKNGMRKTTMNIFEEIKSIMETNSLNRLVQIIAAVFVGLILIKIILMLTRRALNRSKIDSVLYTFIINCIKVACLVLLAISVLNIAGFPTSTFLTVLAAAGAAVALAVKDSLSHFAGGLLILVSKPFSKGDWIESNGVNGRVQEINLLYSKVITFDNRIISIPNSILANNTLINHSGTDLRRIDLKVGIGYDADPEMVKAVLRGAMEQSSYFLRKPEPVIGISNFGDSDVVYDVFGWCRTEDYIIARYDFYELIKNTLAREKIDIPYTQIVLHNAGSAVEERVAVEN